jgi:hypothetical protein
MNLKRQPNRKRYIEILRRMTPAQRLQKSFELTELSRQLLKDGLRHRHPELSSQEIHRLFLDRLARCHNRNY